LRLNVKTDDGKNFREAFNVYGFPTVVFLSPQGGEIDRISGFDGDKDTYMAIIQDYAAGRNTVGDLMQIYSNDTLNIQANYKLAMKYINRWESAKAQKYLTNVLSLDPDDNNGFREESQLHKAIFEARYQDEKDPQSLITFLKQSENKDFLEQGYYHLRFFYRNAKDTINYFKTLEQALSEFQTNTALMNEYAWAVFKNGLADKYLRGIALAEKAVQLEPDATHIWDTLAWLYYANGEHKKAIFAMEKAVAIDSNFQERLTKLTAAITDNRVNMADI
jgi:tetratricopeptide (TPR) repeat protein